MQHQLIQAIGAVLFAMALIHTFAAPLFERLARRHPAHAGLLHLLGEVEVVFGFWAFVLIMVTAVVIGPSAAVGYAESRSYTEPLFVVVVMVVAASRPVLQAVQKTVSAAAHVLPLPRRLAKAWLLLAVVPLLGSLVTEPAAMTIAALALAPLVFRRAVPERAKYLALGVLFVNVSIGGTLTSYAAPPVLMVASAWQWDSAFMLAHLGWKAVLAVVVNATGAVWMLRRHVTDDIATVQHADAQSSKLAAAAVPFGVSLIHFAFLGAVVATAHHPVLFLGLLLMFLGYTQAYARYQSPLRVREALLVGFFLAGLVVLGGMQQWWLQPIVAALEPTALFFGALGLTAITDNAALTYLGSLVASLSDEAKLMLVSGAVAGGGLTVIANAPNPAGAALLRHGFAEGSVGALGLLLGALPPTAVAVLALLLL